MKTLLLTLMLSTVVFGQDFEYGKPGDLKGLKKVYLDTGADMETRNRIIENLEKAKLGVEILDSPEDAEIVMVFASEKSERLVGINTIYNRSETFGSASTTAQRIELIAGAGRVFVRSKDGTKARLILSLQNSQQSKLEKRPSTKFANAFIKAYREANNLPSK